MSLAVNSTFTQCAKGVKCPKMSISERLPEAFDASMESQPSMLVPSVGSIISTPASVCSSSESVTCVTNPFRDDGSIIYINNTAHKITPVKPRHTTVVASDLPASNVSGIANEDAVCIDLETSSRPLTTFTILGDLLPELRNNIWIEAANNTPRDIYACEKLLAPLCQFEGHIAVSETPTNYQGNIEVLGTTIPSVLASCKGAYEAVMGIGMYRPILQMKGGKRAYYINPEIDRIHLGSDFTCFNGIPGGTIADYLVRSHELTMIRNIGFPLHLILGRDFYWSILCLKPLTNLAHLRLEHCVRDPAQKVAFQLELDFEPISLPFVRLIDGDQGYAFNIGAMPSYECCSGMPAVQRAMRNIASPAEHQRLMDVWSRICDLFELVPILPKITLCIHYSV